MRRRSQLLALIVQLACCLLLGCGLQQVELAATSDEVIVLDTVPRDAIARLQEISMDEKVDPMLALDYPADGAAIPANLGPMTFLFGDDKKMMMEPMMMKPEKAGFRAFELRLTGTRSALRIYTSSTHATLPLSRWRALLAAEQSAELTIVVRALAEDDRVVTSRASKLRVLGVTRAGAITYWNDATNTAMRATLDGEGAAMGGISDYPTLVPWQSRSADGSQLASSQDGVLSASIAGSGLTFPWALPLRIDYPSWSPDGSTLALVTVASAMMRPPMMEPGTTMRPPNMMEPGMMAEPGMERSALLQTRVRGASELAEPEALFMADMPNELIRGPSYSPDGRFIAFELAKDKGKAGSLWVVSAQGGVATAVANKLMWKGEGTLPTWLPALDSGYWLVFSQNQAPGSAKLPAEQLQLWAVALELGDRTTPEAVGEPFWLPFQGPSDSNRRALFVAP